MDPFFKLPPSTCVSSWRHAKLRKKKSEADRGMDRDARYDDDVDVTNISLPMIHAQGHKNIEWTERNSEFG